MAGFAEIIGHEQIKEHLMHGLATGKNSHAYIFNGPEGSGKKMLANAFAYGLQCQSHGAKPCLGCPSCKKAMGGNHPDIIYLQHEKVNTISVNDIRQQVNSDIEIKPYSSPYKIYIIDEAEKMNQQAQNALLKTIEEPPAYGVILLLTTNADSFLQTIRSRCVTLNLKAVEDEKIRKYLMSQLHIPDYKADICTAFAQGNVGRAVMLSASEEFTDMKNLLLSHLRKLQKASLYELLPMAKELTDYKDQIRDFLDLEIYWFRDVLLYKAVGNQAKLIFKDSEHEIRIFAGQLSYEGINYILEEIQNTRSRLDANVNFELALEMLYLKIREEYNR